MRKPAKTPTSRFFAAHQNVDALLVECDALCSRDFPICGATFATDTSLAKIIRFLESGRGRLRGFRVTHGTPARVEVPIKKNAPSGGSAGGFLWESEEEGLVNFVSPLDDFGVILRALQRYLLNDLTLVYVQTDGFQRSFDEIVARGKVQSIAVTDYTAWIMTDESRGAETRRTWLRDALDHSEVFEQLSGEDQRLRSLGILVTSGASVRGRIKRDLTYSCDGGFRTFFDEIMGTLRRLAAETRKIFLKRGADESPTRAPRPLRIIYSTPLFEDKQQNQRLIRVLKCLPDAAISVFHPNPFLHASILDYADGSSYTVWVNENSTISIVPEVKASAGSFERLCNHIAECFGEGIVQELAE